MSKKVISGEELAWQRLLEADTNFICKNAVATYNELNKSFTIKSFGQDFTISPHLKQIKGLTEKADYLLNNLSYLYKLSMLWYLIQAKDISLTGRLINPKNLKGGDIFFKGSHVLPLEKISNHYKDKDTLISKAKFLSGKKVEGGDIAIELYPFERIPVRILQWFADDEFDASTELLFDSSCELQLPIDIIWSTAIITINAILLKETST